MPLSSNFMEEINVNLEAISTSTYSLSVARSSWTNDLAINSLILKITLHVYTGK